MRYDLAFFLCCCKSFVGDSEDNDGDSKNEDYYALLGLDRRDQPTIDDIKRAYKRQSLNLHPDKLAQKGLTVTPDLSARFTHMKEAYEILSDPHKKETYDAVGAKGLKYMEEPFSIDPAELAHNFAKSSVVDRSKIFAIFVAIAVAVLLQPILVCFKIDGRIRSSWTTTLIPLWLWNAFLIFYHSRVIAMGPIPRPDHIDPSEWIDPLPMHKRYFSFARFLLICVFEILVALKLDSVLNVSWWMIFLPVYVWEISTLCKKWPLAKMRIVTVEDLEAALGKPFSEFTATEKELIGQRYSVVSSTQSPDFDIAQKLKTRAKHEILKSIFRIVFCIILILQLERGSDSQWNWWLVFIPFWIMVVIVCFVNLHSFIEVQKMAAEKDPTLFSTMNPEATMHVNQAANAADYGAVGPDGSAAPQPTSPLSPEEQEELKAQVMASGSKVVSICCSQTFLLIMLCLIVAKLQGASFSSFIIISPFLASAGFVLCCIGCAIFGVTEVHTGGGLYENEDEEMAAATAYHATAEHGQAPSSQPTQLATAATATAPQSFQPTSTTGGANPIYIPPEPTDATPIVTHTSVPPSSPPPPRPEQWTGTTKTTTAVPDSTTAAATITTIPPDRRPSTTGEAIHDLD